MINATFATNSIIYQATDTGIHAVPTEFSLLFDPAVWQVEDLRAAIEYAIESTIFILDSEDVATNYLTVDNGFMPDDRIQQISAPQYELPNSTFELRQIERIYLQGRPCLFCSVEKVLQEELAAIAKREGVTAPELHVRGNDTPVFRHAPYPVTVVEVFGLYINIHLMYSDRIEHKGSTLYISSDSTVQEQRGDTHIEVNAVNAMEDLEPQIMKLISRSALVSDGVLYFKEEAEDTVQDEDVTS